MNSKKIIALLLALVMVFGLVACNKTDAPADDTKPAADTPAADDDTPADDYDELSWAIYEDVLGEFYEVYTDAKENYSSLSERWAKMAVAEAKLLGSGVFLPLGAQGGNYAISRVAPYTASSALWGNDSYRYHNVLVATEPLLPADRDEMKAKWAEICVDDEVYYADWAKEFLEGKGYTLQDTYTFGYSSDPQTWDVLATSMAADSEAIVNTYDGLIEYDAENKLQPALAESWSNKVNDDGTETWTFKIREGAKWVDSQGREVADVTADDFVAGMQHMMDAAGGLEYLAYEAAGIVNSYEYIDLQITDFNEVGVKAVDTYTLEYTLAKPCSFFQTMLGYGVFAPMNRDYFLSKGGAFGVEEYAAAVDAGTCTYGQTANDIAYCGPYLVSNHTAENTIVFSANPKYWNADGITMNKITWMYNDGEDPLKAYNDCMSGAIDGAGLNASAVKAARADGNFEKYAYVSSCDATTFNAFVNLRRGILHNYNDENAVVSPKTEEQVARSDAAMLNKNFRLALATAVDLPTYNAQVVGEDLKLVSLRNTYTPGNFVQLKEEVTIDINGTATTYPAGTQYGKIIQDQLDADGIKITAWDPTLEAGIGSSDGFSGWYNPEVAAEYLAAAIEELAAEGVEVSAENPIYIDLPVWTSNDDYLNRGNAYKQSVEASLGGCVIVNMVECVDVMEWYYAGYYPPTGAEGNYDVCDISGWGPDYGDPQTYLDTMLPDYAGYMTKAIGIF